MLQTWTQTKSLGIEEAELDAARTKVEVGEWTMRDGSRLGKTFTAPTQLSQHTLLQLCKRLFEVLVPSLVYEIVPKRAVEKHHGTNVVHQQEKCVLLLGTT